MRRARGDSHDLNGRSVRRRGKGIHIGAKAGQIALTVLLPGDPRRAKFIAETLLENAVCCSEVRGMLGFTGRYGEKVVSVLGTGRGIPSMEIYVHELIAEYRVKTLICVGMCGAVQPSMGATKYRA